MANVNVTFQELHAAASKLTGGQADIEDRLNELKRYIENLVTSGFVTDRASGAFEGAYEQFTRGAQETIAGLDALSRFLTASANAFSDTDANLASRINH